MLFSLLGTLPGGGGQGKSQSFIGEGKGESRLALDIEYSLPPSFHMLLLDL